MISGEANRALQNLDRESIDATIRRFWRDRLIDAPAAIARHCTPDVVFQIIGSGREAGEAACQGRDAVSEMVRTIDTNVEFLSFDILDMIIDGDKAALLWQAKLAHRGTGAVSDLSVFDLITIENGLVAKYIEFLDSDSFRRLMRGEPQPQLGRRANRKPAGAYADRRVTRAVTIEERDRIEAMLRAWWDRRVSAGSVAIDEYFATDGELHLVGDPTTVPFARHYMGAAEVKALIDLIDMEFEWMRSVTGKVLVSGDRAAMRWMADVRHRGTCAQGRVHAFDHFTLRNGRILVQTEFFDTASTATWIEG